MTSSVPTTEDPPFDASTFYVVGGTLATDAPSYVTRQADRQLREALWRGDFCYVLDTRQVGKSSLMVRAASFLKQQGVAVAILDLTRLGQSLNLEQWYYGLLLNLGAQIGRRDEVRAYWQQNRDMGPMQRWMEALRHVALPPAAVDSLRKAADHPCLVIFIDEIDNVLNLPFDTDEFFAAIRECYTRRAHDPELYGLTFCLLGSTTPDSLIRDVRTTPFNIGIRIEPTDFTLEEAAPLKEGIAYRVSGGAGQKGVDSAKVAEALLARVLYWTGGHPYLTQRLCRAVMEALSNPTSDTRYPTPASLVDRLCAQLFFTKAAREGESNLTFVSNRILKSEVDQAALLDLLMQVRANKHVKNDPASPLCAILRLSGMVRVADGTLEIRNQIYRHVFDPEWIRSNMPDAERRRQRVAYRRGQLRAAAVFGLIGVALVLSLLALSAIQKAAISRAHEAQTAAANRKLEIALKDERHALELVQMAKRRADAAARKADAAAAREKIAHKDADYERRMAVAQSKAATAAYELAKRNEKLAEANAQRALRFAREATHTRGRLAYLLRRDERFVYPSRIQLAAHALDLGDVAAARSYLQQCVPSAYQADIRGFEWRYLMDQCRDQSVLTFSAHSGGVSAVTYSPGDSLIASVGRDSSPGPGGPPPLEGRLSLWDAATGHAVASIHSSAFRFNRLTFSPGGQRLAAYEGDNVIHILDVTTLTLDRNIQIDAGVHILATAFSPDDSILASADSSGLVQIWAARSGLLLRALDRQNAGLNNLAFSPDGRLLAVGFRGQGEAVGKVFDVRTGREIAMLGKRQELNGNTPPAICMAFSADSQYVAVSCGNHLLYLFQSHDGHVRGRLNAHQFEFSALAFSPDQRLLTTGRSDGWIDAWDISALQSGKPISEAVALCGHTGAIHTMAFTSDGKTLATAGNDGNIKQWNVAALAASHYKAGADVARQVTYSSDGKLLARVGSLNGDGPMTSDVVSAVRIYDGVTQRERLTLQNKGMSASIGAAVSQDGRLIATSGEDRIIRLWDTRTGQQTGVLQGAQEQSHILAFSPDGKLLAAAGQGGRDGGQIRLWNVQTGQQIDPIERGGGWIETLTFSPDGSLLVAGDGAGELRWWTMPGRREVTPFPGDRMQRRPGRPFGRPRQAPLLALAFSPDGKWLATGGADALIHIWDVATRRQIATLRGHLDAVLALAYSPDSKTLASGSKEGIIKLWVPSSEQESPVQEALTRQTDQFSVQSLAFSPDGKTLVSGHSGGAMLFWRTSDIPFPPAIAEKRPL